MRPTALIAGLLIFGALGRPAAQAPASNTITLDTLTHRVMLAEAALTARMKGFRPIVEVYAQHVQADARLGTVPVRDEYFLGRFEWHHPEGLRMTPLTAPLTGVQATRRTRLFGTQLNFDGFAAMTVPDWRLLDAKHHAFTYLRREVLGEVRCLVFEVAPRVETGEGFTGRIWVEDRDFNIVRFNGVTRNAGSGRRQSFSVDSWRANVRPGLWLPSYVYSELQSDEGARIKSQVRLWGYGLPGIPAPPPLPAAVTIQQAHENVLTQLSRDGLLAPPGEVDKVLETVLTNLQATRKLTTDPVYARVLLTSSLESYTVGRTILLSRGLIDVLPDEASLAAMLAHELAHAALGHTGHTLAEEQSADAQMMVLLRNSPYQDKLADADAFQRAVAGHSKTLKHLISAHIAERATLPVLPSARPDHVATLPLGARVVMNAWTGELELLKDVQAPAPARDSASLTVTPLVPYLRYFDPLVVQDR